VHGLRLASHSQSLDPAQLPSRQVQA
jgi:hypothetical protein